MSKVYYKEIPLFPTKFTVEVFVSKKYESVCKKASEVLGNTEKFWKEEIGPFPCVMSYDSDKGKHILMFLPDFKPAVIVHEAVHVTWYLDKKVGFSFNYESQEIQAYMTEYIFEEILKMKL